MKTICAWCGKVIREDFRENLREHQRERGKEGLTHGICRDCFEKFERELREAYPDAGEPEPGPRAHRTLEDFAALLRNGTDLATLLGILLALILLAGSALHFLTGGWLPDPIQWMVERPIGPLK